MKISIKKVLLVGGVVCGFTAVGLLAWDNARLRREIHNESREVNSRLVEVESKVYCNGKWIKDLQNDTTDADAIAELDKRLTSDEYRNAEDVEELRALLEALKASQTDAKEEEGINVPLSDEAPIVGVSEPVSSDCLTATGGVYWYGDQKETWYNLPMEKVIEQAQNNGIYGEYWVRDDGVKMYGDYIMCACNRDVHPMGSLVETSLGTGISLDTGAFADINPTQVDIAVGW
jgi:uncharacterized coiled-coil protein SlyX